MKTSAAREWCFLWLVLIVAAAVLGAAARSPLPVSVGTVQASSSPVIFLGESPANNSLHGIADPITAMAVAYYDPLPNATVLRVSFYLDGMNLTSAGFFNDTAFTLPVGFAFRDGPHFANFALLDSYGIPAYHNWTFTVDTIPPFLLVTSPAYPMVPLPAVYVNGTTFPALVAAAPVNVTVTPLPSHVTLWSLANLTTGAFSVLTPLTEGPNVLFVNATDAAGNTASDMVTIVSDTVKPKLAIDTPANLSVSPTNIVRVAGTSDFGAYLTVNGFSVVVAPRGTWSVDLALPEGPNAIVAAAADQVGNLNVAAVGILVDSDVPQITLASPLPALTNRSSIDVSGRVTDTKVLALVARCGQLIRPLTFDPATGSFRTEFTGLPDATYTVEITAVDAAGRSTTVGSDVLVDTTPPVVRLTTPPDGLETTQPSVPLAGTVDEANATVLVNDQVIRPDAAGHWATIVALVEGSSVVRISAVDAAGNRATPILLHVSYFSPYPDLANRTATNEDDIAALAGFTRLALVAIALLAIGVELVLYTRTERKVRENRRVLTAAVQGMKRKPKAPGP